MRCSKNSHEHERYHAPPRTPPPPKPPEHPPETKPLKHCTGQQKIDKNTQFPAVEASSVRAVTPCPREEPLGQMGVAPTSLEMSKKKCQSKFPKLHPLSIEGDGTKSFIQ